MKSGLRPDRVSIASRRARLDEQACPDAKRSSTLVFRHQLETFFLPQANHGRRRRFNGSKLVAGACCLTTIPFAKQTACVTMPAPRAGFLLPRARHGRNAAGPAPPARSGNDENKIPPFASNLVWTMFFGQRVTAFSGSPPVPIPRRQFRFR